MNTNIFKSVWFWIVAIMSIVLLVWVVCMKIQLDKMAADKAFEEKNYQKFDAVRNANNSIYDKHETDIDSSKVKASQFLKDLEASRKNDQAIINHYKKLYNEIFAASADSDIVIALRLLAINDTLPLERQ